MRAKTHICSTISDIWKYSGGRKKLEPGSFYGSIWQLIAFSGGFSVAPDCQRKDGFAIKGQVD
jgi:hypothetical protein